MLTFEQSRAQAELNFAVYYSYLHDHVMMIDTLSSSIEYMNFDDDRKDEVGYRLPADPYWIAPPQGSIVPLWHQGGAPNYQPKPMICRHVQDPVKAWRRETPAQKRSAQKGLIKTLSDAHEARPRIRIFSCSAGVNAGKMASRLCETMQRLVHEIDDPFDVDPEKPLNKLDLAETGPEDIILIIASTTGRGEIPHNAQRFVQRYESTEPLDTPPRFSCFANGDSTYGDTYNASGKIIQQLMTRMGCRPLLGHCFAGDTALHNPDWESFTHWLENIDHLILGNHHKIELPTSLTEMEGQTTSLTEMPTATLVRVQQLDPKGIIHITLDIRDTEYQEMDHLKILAPNPDSEVERVLAALKLSSDRTFDWHHQNASTFLSRYVDLSHCFKELSWYPGFDDLPVAKHTQLKSADVLSVLEELGDRDYDVTMVERICKDMASIVPRIYSVASCPVFSNTNAIQEEDSGKTVDIMVKVNPGGRFSDAFLLNAKLGAQMRFGLTSPDTWKLIQAQKPNAPFIAIATGSGIGPVRALLQRRMIDVTRTTGEAGRPRASKMSHFSSLGAGSASIYSESRRGSVSSVGSQSRRGAKAINHHAHLGVASTRESVSLFAGFKKEDTELIQQIIRPASHAGILDVVELCPSNEEKVRIHDHILLENVKDKLVRKLRDRSCIVFVCANEWAAEGAVVNLSLIAGANVKELLGERYIEEIFRG
jgi:sulfite reductase alpha subunit-like flavoprotein